MKRLINFFISLFDIKPKQPENKERKEFVELNKSLLGEEYAGEFWDKYH